MRPDFKESFSVKLDKLPITLLKRFIAINYKSCFLKSSRSSIYLLGFFLLVDHHSNNDCDDDHHNDNDDHQDGN